MKRVHVKMLAAACLASMLAAPLADAGDARYGNAGPLVELKNPRLVATSQQMVTFDDTPFDNEVLDGQYPTDLIDWGTNVWFAKQPTGKFKTPNLRLYTSSRRSGSFAFLAPRRVVSLDILNRGSSDTTVSLACAGQTKASVVARPTILTKLVTNWTANCSPVTLTVGNGTTLYDNLLIEDASSTPPPPPPPAPPIAANDAYSVLQGTVLTVPASGVLVNDTAGTGGTLTALPRSATGHGTIALASNGSLVYTPEPAFTGADAFTYVAHNTGGDSNLATVTFTVTATPPPPPPPPPTTSYWIPPAVTSWDWQLDTPINQTTDVTMYDIEMFNNDASVIASLHAKGRKVFCYIAVGSWENWRPDAAAFPESVKGATYAGFPDERWLDIRRWDILGPIMTARFNLAKEKGCDGVEPDNVDGYDTTAHESSGFPLTYNDQIVFNKRIAALAHSLGMSVGLKNDINQTADLEPYFDWALSEQCFQYNECQYFAPFTKAGKAVFEVEYELATTAFCPKANALNLNSLKKRTSLDSYRVACR